MKPWSRFLLCPAISNGLIAADYVQEMGYDGEAERYRWIAKAGKKPRDYSKFYPERRFSWYVHGSNLKTRFPVEEHDDLVGSAFDKCPRDWPDSDFLSAPTAEEAEDRLVEFLCTLDVNPLEEQAHATTPDHGESERISTTTAEEEATAAT